MIRGAVGHLDVAQIVLYAFWFFFAGLVWYLRREDRREGYPLQSEGVPQFDGYRSFLLLPAPKVFRLASGAEIEAPNFKGDTRAHDLEKTESWPGAPFQPKGDPMLAGVGPGSYSLRPEQTYKTLHGEDLVVPLRVATNFALSPEGGNPIGYTVVGADKFVAGTIKDAWVDRSESILRYYEVALADGSGSMIVPVYFADVEFTRRRVVVNALLANQFTRAPRLASPDRITMQEEDKVAAYVAAGTLYATPERAEPLT